MNTKYKDKIELKEKILKEILSSLSEFETTNPADYYLGINERQPIYNSRYSFYFYYGEMFVTEQFDEKKTHIIDYDADVIRREIKELKKKLKSFFPISKKETKEILKLKERELKLAAILSFINRASAGIKKINTLKAKIETQSKKILSNLNLEN